jgi:hypothetical protein
MNFTKIKYWISLSKTKMSRGYSYIATFGIPFLVARQLGEMFPNWNWMWFFVPSLVLIWIIGEIDYRKGLFGNELAFSFEKNPAWTNRKEVNKSE